MIFIDYKPVLVHPELTSKIVFTDSGECEDSIIFMDKKYAPERESRVWMLIKNPKYNPDDPLNDREVDLPGNPDEDPYDPGNPPPLPDPLLDHAENPYWLFRRWMWVSDIYSNEYPANFQRDENGDPLTNPDGSLFLGNWDDRDGIVKVVMREHKHTLTRQCATDNVNILQRASYLLQIYNSWLPTRFFNGMTWIEICDFLQIQKLKLDYEMEYEDPEDPPTILPSEYPPVIPHHCTWMHWTLAECLDDLLKNFESRVIEVVDEDAIPTRNDYLTNKEYITEEIYTHLVWKRRREIQYRDDIIYTSIQWPVLTDEALMDEKNSTIHYHRLYNNYSAGGIYQSGLYPDHHVLGYNFLRNNWDNTTRSTLDFICNLYPYSPDYMPTDFDELNQYLKENHVNVDVYYAFTTSDLPIDFYETGEWSRIELRYGKGTYEYLVEHKPRMTWFPKPYVGFQLYAQLRGVIKYVHEDHVTCDQLWDTTNNILIGDDIEMPAVLGQFQNAQVGDIANFVISGDNISLYSVEHTSELVTEQIPVKWNGENVEKFIWTIDNWNENITDEDLEVADHATSLDRVFNYTLEDVQNLDGSGDPFNVVEYYVADPGSFGYNINLPTTVNMLALTFKMRATREEVVEYLEANTALENIINDYGFIDSIADKWLQTYERLTINVGLSHSVNTFEMWMTEYTFDRVGNKTGILSDMSPGQYLAWGVSQGNTFPYTHTAIPFVPEIKYAQGLSLIKQSPTGLPYSVVRLKEILWFRYYSHFRNHDVTMSLISSPP